MVSRLPAVAGDTGAWGTVLNDYLAKTVGQVPATGKRFYLDAYGADPTGATASDAAWTACYADALAAVGAQGPSSYVGNGAVIYAGPGYYLFSPGTIAVADHRIGLIGAGKTSTIFRCASSGTGSLVKITANPAAHQSAPVGGFTVLGFYAAAGVNGLEYGDRPEGFLFDVCAREFFGAGSRGFWFHDHAGNSEGTWAQCEADQNTVNYDFDCDNPGVGSFDWGSYHFHVSCTNEGGQNATGLRFVNGQHCYGGQIHLAGNIEGDAGFSSTLMQVGASATDTCYVSKCHLHICVEAQGGGVRTGTVTDLVVKGADSSKGIVQCYGEWAMPTFTGATLVAGSVTSPAVVTMWGTFQGPLFTSHGTLTSLGSAAAGLSTYSG